MYSFFDSLLFDGNGILMLHYLIGDYMFKALLLFLLPVLTSSLAAGTRFDYTMQIGSDSRQFIVSRPEGDAPENGYPVVFVFHGTGQGGQYFYDTSEWKEKGDLEKFLTVYPTALRYNVTEDGVTEKTTKWHNGALEEMAVPGQYLRDDVYFVRKMVDTVKLLFPVNAQRIYATGFSNGGGFVSKLAVEASDIFAALASHAGSLHPFDSAKAKNNVPFWLTLGTLDEKWLVNYVSISEFPFNDSILLYLNGVMTRYLGCLGLTWDHSKNSSSIALTYIFEEPATVEVTTEFRFSIIKNLFHQYPNGTNVPYKAADILWPYFEPKTLITYVNERNEDNGICLFPNPAGDYIEIAPLPENINIYNILGQPVIIPMPDNCRINISGLTPGVYFIKTGSEKKMFVKK